MNLCVGFIGLGLIGGSIAKSLKKSDNSIHIVAFNRSKTPLLKAHEDGVVDEVAYEIDNTFNKCNVIFLCTPVEYNSIYLGKIADIINENCIITDVGSVKGYIHQTVSGLHLEKNFIGGHPMAGSEKTGYDAATDILLQNAYYAITPTIESKKEDIDLLVSLVKLTGAIPIVCNPDIHDYAVAGISHVPHLIASGLVNMVHDNDTDDELMKTLAAGGFKDITRIASSSAEMWSQICTTNKDQISIVLDKYISYLSEVKNMIDSEDRDGIFKMFSDSKEYRDSIGINNGPIVRNYTIFCNIEDTEGALSSITSLLSDNHINIKNIEIIHNREYVDGVLQIAFYDEQNRTSAKNILSEKGYFIHK